MIYVVNQETSLADINHICTQYKRVEFYAPTTAIQNSIREKYSMWHEETCNQTNYASFHVYTHLHSMFSSEKAT